MKCREIMSANVRQVRPEEKVVEAARMMASEKLGWLVVCSDEGRPLGVLTDGDITVHVVAQGRSPKHTSVVEIMSSPVQSVLLDSPVDLAAELMGKTGLWRLPVLDEGGQVDGVVSIADLLAQGAPDLARTIAQHLRAHGRGFGDPATPIPARLPPGTFEVKDELDEDAPAEPPVINPARAEAEAVASGGNNPLKEFPT